MNVALCTIDCAERHIHDKRAAEQLRANVRKDTHGAEEHSLALGLPPFRIPRSRFASRAAAAPPAPPLRVRRAGQTTAGPIVGGCVMGHVPQGSLRQTMP